LSVRTIRSADDFEGLADLLTERITPVYQRYAAAEGLREEAFSGLTARTEEEINRAYLETLEGSGRAVQGLADILTERITPVCRKYATQLGQGTGRAQHPSTRGKEPRISRNRRDTMSNPKTVSICSAMAAMA